jgi:hypothetical protein
MAEYSFKELRFHDAAAARKYLEARVGRMAWFARIAARLIAPRGCKASRTAGALGLRTLPRSVHRNRNGGASVAELNRLKELEGENAKLKRMYADLALEDSAVKEVLSRKLYRRQPSARQPGSWWRKWADGGTRLCKRPAVAGGCITGQSRSRTEKLRSWLRSTRSCGGAAVGLLEVL